MDTSAPQMQIVGDIMDMPVSGNSVHSALAMSTSMTTVLPPTPLHELILHRDAHQGALPAINNSDMADFVEHVAIHRFVFDAFETNTLCNSSWCVASLLYCLGDFVYVFRILAVFFVNT
eukprot:6042827-Amphidinium_carterae.1